MSQSMPLKHFKIQAVVTASFR